MSFVFRRCLKLANVSLTTPSFASDRESLGMNFLEVDPRLVPRWIIRRTENRIGGRECTSEITALEDTNQ